MVNTFYRIQYLASSIRRTFPALPFKVADRSAHTIFRKTLAVILMLLNNISATTLIYLSELIINLHVQAKE